MIELLDLGRSKKTLFEGQVLEERAEHQATFQSTSPPSDNGNETPHFKTVSK